MLGKRAICTLLALVCGIPLLSQNPEAGVTILSQAERLLRIEADRPLDSAAYILASDYQINISAEDPPFACSHDIVDKRPSRKNPLAAEHSYLPKGSSFEVRFSVSDSRYPLHSKELLDQVVAANNRKSKFLYRVRQEGDFFSFVPISGRDRSCHVIEIDPLLDRKISAPKENIDIYRAIAAVEFALSQKAREPVHVNTQNWLNRIPDLHVSFPSGSGTARDILLTMIKATHYRFYWLLREQPVQGGWTINLLPLTGRIVKNPVAASIILGSCGQANSPRHRCPRHQRYRCKFQIAKSIKDSGIFRALPQRDSPRRLAFHPHLT